MQSFDPHRVALRRTGAATAQNNSTDSKSLHGSPSFEKVASEIGLILLLALGLPVVVALFARLAALF
jgi:hypothetical protein